VTDLPFRWTLVSAEDPESAFGEGSADRLLSDGERCAFESFRFARRRSKWLLGRLAAKTLLRTVWAETAGEVLDPRQIIVQNDPSGVPFAEIAGRGPLPWPISISHRFPWGVAAVGLPPARALGIDLETVEPRSQNWFRDYFGTEEIAEVAAVDSEEKRDLAVARIWSAKESVLKAFGVGLRLDTRSIRVCQRGQPGVQAAELDESASADWLPLDAFVSGISHGAPTVVRAYWRRGPGYVLTAAVLT
jgi:phosphopantetheinyl transferase